MKKFSLSLLAALLLVCLCACAGQSTPKVVDWNVDIPESFTEYDDDATEFYYYHADGSSITLNLQKTGGVNTDDAFNDLTADTLRSAVEDAFAASGVTNLEFQNETFEHIEVSGIPAYRWSYTIEYNGTAITQTMVGVNSNPLLTFTYTDYSGSAAWSEVFDQSIANLELVTE